MSSIFTKIIKGEIPCHKIAETTHCFAFLDIMPLKMGHTLVVPKQEVDYIFDLEDELLTELMRLSKQLAPAIKQAFPCKRVGIAAIGLEVPHTHIHLVPIDGMQDINFTRDKLQPTQEELAKAADKIKTFL